VGLGRRIYLYDELHRLIQVICEVGKKVTNTYDAAGNRITLTNE
jgi:YD repeat-containing protein